MRFLNIAVMFLILLMCFVVLAGVAWAWMYFGPAAFIALFILLYLCHKLVELYEYLTRKKS